MNRQTFRTVPSSQDADQSSLKSVSDAMADALSDAADATRKTASDLKASAKENTTTLAADGKELAEKSLAYVQRTVRENPTLAIAGVVAIGALGALALRQRYAEPKSPTRRLQRDIARQTRDIRHAIRDELRASGASDRFAELGRSLSSIDLKPFLQPVVDQAANLAKQANEKLSASGK